MKTFTSQSAKPRLRCSIGIACCTNDVQLEVSTLVWRVLAQRSEALGRHDRKMKKQAPSIRGTVVCYLCPFAGDTETSHKNCSTHRHQARWQGPKRQPTGAHLSRITGVGLPFISLTLFDTYGGVISQYSGSRITQRSAMILRTIISHNPSVGLGEFYVQQTKENCRLFNPAHTNCVSWGIVFKQYCPSPQRDPRLEGLMGPSRGSWRTSV